MPKKINKNLELEKRDYDAVRRFFTNLRNLGVMDSYGVITAMFDWYDAAQYVSITWEEKD